MWETAFLIKYYRSRIFAKTSKIVMVTKIEKASEMSSLFLYQSLGSLFRANGIKVELMDFTSISFIDRDMLCEVIVWFFSLFVSHVIAVDRILLIMEMNIPISHETKFAILLFWLFFNIISSLFRKPKLSLSISLAFSLSRYLSKILFWNIFRA